MKPYASRTSGYAASTVPFFRAFWLVPIVAGLLLPAAAAGQKVTWQFDSDHSTARLLLGSRNDLYAYGAGVARVSGSLVLNEDDPVHTVLNLGIYPGAAGFEENDPVSARSGAVRMTFETKQAARMADGGLAVTGDLVVTEVEPSVTVEPNEGYSGVVDGDPVRETARHEVTFVFPAAALVALRDQQATNHSIAAATTIGQGSLPPLAPAIMDMGNPVAEGEDCREPSTSGEDYSGLLCTGKKVVASADPTVLTSAVGEDYRGIAVVPVAGSQVMIQLDLALVRRGTTLRVAGQ